MSLAPDLADAIEQAIGLARGEPFRIAAATAVSGGCIHRSWCLNGRDGQRYFVKTNAVAQADVFAAEADGLGALAESGVRTPGVIALGDTAEHAFLVLEHLTIRPLTREDGLRAGEALAALHHQPAPDYGWHRDNYIGATPQANGGADYWPNFFARQRLQPQLARAAANGYRGALQDDGARICEKISALFLDYRPTPALLHGDLWSGNVGALDSGEPVLFDPAVYRGDREADLAMSELFGGLPESFYAAYRRAAPLDPGYEQRKTLYNLYHVLNHLNLFGRAYLRQAERMAHTLVEALRR